MTFLGSIRNYRETKKMIAVTCIVRCTVKSFYCLVAKQKLRTKQGMGGGLFILNRPIRDFSQNIQHDYIDYSSNFPHNPPPLPPTG